MREQSKWRRVIAAVLIGVGLALVGAGVVSASSAGDASWTADASWTLSVVSTPTDITALQ
jgi:hypothetical protein